MTTPTRQWTVLACALALAPALVCVPAAAEVKTRVRADGTLEIYNEGGGKLSWRSRPLTLQPVPRADWSVWIARHAGREGVDTRLVQAIMQVESSYNPRAVSRTGAMGLMQLMPDTARLVQVDDAFSPEQNIRGGVTYLRQMIDRFAGRLELAIAAYNAGPGAVQRHGGIPPYEETRDYVDRVLTLYRGSSTSLTGLVASGGPVRTNGLMQSGAASPLREALAGGMLRPPPPSAALAPPAVATVAGRVAPVAAVAPAPAPAAPKAVEPLAVPALLPERSAPAPVAPTSGG